MEIKLNNSDNFLDAWQKIKDALEEQVTLVIPTGHPLLDNVLNLKLLKAEAERLGKTLKYLGADLQSTELLRALFGELPATSVKPKTAGHWGFLPNWASLSRRFQGKIFALSFGLFLLLGLGLVAAYQALVTYVPKATVTLKFSRDSLTKTVTVDLLKQLAAQKVSVYATASATAKTTGKKTEGNFASGSVLIFNKTDHPKTFAKNTLLSLITTGSGEWFFTLNEGVTVPERSIASVSATPNGEQTTYNYGQLKVSVTAKALGEKYNLPAQSQFNVGDENTNDFIAKNGSDFTGGREVEVAVVTQTDQDGLATQVQASLNDLLQPKIAASVPVGFISPGGDVYTKETTRSFDHGIGEKADSVSLTITSLGITYAYKEADLQGLWQELVTAAVPANYVLSDAERTITSNLVVASVDQGTPQIILKGVSYVVPRYLAADIQRSLAGQSLAAAKSYLEGLSGVEQVKIEVWPPLLGLASHLPIRPANINVIIQKP